MIADFYRAKAVEAAKRVAESAASFAAEPTRANAARLRLDMEYWRDVMAIQSAVECHKL